MIARGMRIFFFFYFYLATKSEHQHYFYLDILIRSKHLKKKIVIVIDIDWLLNIIDELVAAMCPPAISSKPIQQSAKYKWCCLLNDRHLKPGKNSIWKWLPKHYLNRGNVQQKKGIAHTSHSIIIWHQSNRASTKKKKIKKYSHYLTIC